MSNLQNIHKTFTEPAIDLSNSSENESTPKALPPFLRQDMEEYYRDSKDSNNLGNYIEGYFFLKLKKCLKAQSDFKGNYSIVDHIKKINESIFHFVKQNWQDISSDKLKIQGMNLIHEAENIFDIKADRIQIDSFFPNINGKILNNFLKDVKECSYSSLNGTNIDENKDYNLIVESTHNILSTLNKKSKQLQNYFTIFSKSRKLYLENMEMLKEFYIKFLKNFKIIGEQTNLTHKDLIDKSNFIFMICSNKNYESTKIFQESLHDKNQFNKLIQILNDNKKKTEEVKAKISGKINDNKSEKIDEEVKESHDNTEFNNNQKKEGISTGNEIENKIIITKENKVYNPGEYIEKFKLILNDIISEGDNFLFVYFDTYEQLFVPYPNLMEKMNYLCSKCLEFEKQISIFNKFIQTYHPEFCTKKGEVNYEKLSTIEIK